MESNIMRKESTLILPYNTLRIVDVLLQFEIYNSVGLLYKEPFERTVFKMVSRKEKELSKLNKGVDQSLLDQLLKVNFAEYYDMSPRTSLYEILQITKHQKFMTKMIVLFDDKKAKDDVFDNVYYDGTIEGLEKNIIDNEITCIVLDDIKLLKKISDRGNIDLNYKTIMLSRMGYNYYRDDTGRLLLKYYDKIIEKYPHMELTVVSLTTFKDMPLSNKNNRRREIM